MLGTAGIVGGGIQRVSHALCVAMALLSGACVTGRATVHQPLPLSDTRVRIELARAHTVPFTRRGQTLIGTLVRRDSVALELRVGSDDPPLYVPIASLRAAYRSDGARPRWRAATAGALRSGAIGVISGLLTVAIAPPHSESRTHVVVARGIGGAAFGIVLGVISPGEQWRRLRLPIPSGNAPLQRPPESR